jgi:hypothetical protein
MSKNVINYATLIDEAMHNIVKKCLRMAAAEGLPGDHHFFISFLTNHKGVKLSSKLRHRYPEEMTIVLQYQFEELKVEEKGFSVVLSFDGIKETVVVPFEALTSFADPSVKFGLQFRSSDELDESFDDIEYQEEWDYDNSSPTQNSTTKIAKNGESNVVSLDKFRKK